MGVFSSSSFPLFVSLTNFFFRFHSHIGAMTPQKSNTMALELGSSRSCDPKT